MLLIGIVNASEVSQNTDTDTDTLSQELVVKDIHTASNEDAVPQDKELGADLQTDEKYEYNVNESTTKTLNMNKDNDETTPSSVLEYSSVNYDSAPKTYTVTIASDNQLICKSNLFILEYLNKLFNMTFINGHMKVYIDGKLVFEGDTTDDLTQAIFEIMDDYLGEHEITVEFTDSEGKTNNYKEKIIVE